MTEKEGGSGGEGAGCNGGAGHGEIPAASAGMTEKGARVWRRWGRGYDGILERDGGGGVRVAGGGG